ncbi:MAG: poly(ethylene terephthalate) hydrolase family protein [Planctomycetota bacterium]|jgi:dienelactone hydrolase
MKWNVLWLLLFLAGPVSALPDHELKPVFFLVGEWSGEGQHPYGRYKETQSAKRAVDGDIIEVRTKSVMGARTVHEDLRVLSFDAKTKKIRMRQWAKGVLRIYSGAVQENGTVVFTQQAVEGVAQDKWRYTFTPQEAGGFDYRVDVDGKAFVSGRLRADLKDPGQGGGLGMRQYNATVAGMRVEVHHPDGKGPFPVIVFSPGGNAQSSRGYAPYGRFWATWGYVTVIVAFNDADAKKRAPKFTKVLDWVEVENAREGSPLRGLINTKRLAVAGHSRGGNAAIRTARADGRVRACLALAPSGPEEKLEGDGKAALCVIVGDKDQYRAAATKVHANAAGEGFLFVIPNMTHMLEPREATLKLVKRATAFWNYALKGEKGYRAHLAEKN